MLPSHPLSFKMLGVQYKLWRSSSCNFLIMLGRLRNRYPLSLSLWFLTTCLGNDTRQPCFSVLTSATVKVFICRQTTWAWQSLSVLPHFCENYKGNVSCKKHFKFNVGLVTTEGINTETYLNFQEQVTNSPDCCQSQIWSKEKEPTDNTKGQVLIRHFSLLEQ